MMHLKYFPLLTALLLLMGCTASTSPKDVKAEFLSTLDAGNITEARSMLYKIEGGALYQCAELLINEYIALDDVQSAIAVYERSTPNHCSTYDMKWATYSHNGYENRVTEILYNALINADDFEGALKYHPLEYETPTYAGNGGSYFAYISDVLIHLCQQGRKVEAQQFLDKHSLWFLKNVDNGEWGEKYPAYRYGVVLPKLQSIINKSY